MSKMKRGFTSFDDEGMGVARVRVIERMTVRRGRGKSMFFFLGVWDGGEREDGMALKMGFGRCRYSISAISRVVVGIAKRLESSSSLQHASLILVISLRLPFPLGAKNCRCHRSLQYHHHHERLWGIHI